MYGNFRPLSHICFYHSPPCNTRTQEQQRVKFNTRVERQLPRPSNIIYTFGANTKPLGAKVWGKSDNKTFQHHRTFRYFSFLSLTFWFWTSRCGSFICFPMISLRKRKCVTDRKLNSSIQDGGDSLVAKLREYTWTVYIYLRVFWATSGTEKIEKLASAHLLTNCSISTSNLIVVLDNPGKKVVSSVCGPWTGQPLDRTLSIHHPIF